MDGGGNNARLLKLLRNGKNIDEGQSWLDEDQVSFLNPADPSRRVAVFHCTTHNLKGSRNALLNSDCLSKKPSRDFKFGSIKFGWQTIRGTYSRDQKKSVPDTSLRKGSENPDRWNKMNASFAKDPFKPDTLYDMANFLADELVRLGFDTAKQSILVMEQRGSDAEMVLKYVDLMQKLVKEGPLSTRENQDLVQVQSDLLVLEYCASVSLIYLEFFMNRHCQIRIDNVDDVMEKVKLGLRFFARWREDQLVSKATLKQQNPSSKEWEKWFISHQTYLNMRIGISGFFVYARYVLAHSGAISVPFLHSNTSILEAYFSMIRAGKGDTALQYPGMVGTLDTSKAVLYLENNKMYEKESMLEGNSPGKSLENITRRKDEMRTNLVQVWLNARKKPRQCKRTLKLTDTFYDDDSPTKSSTRIATATISKSMDLNMYFNYTDLIWAEPDFVEYAKLSVGTDSQRYFEMFSLLTRKEEKEVNDACRHIFGDIVKESKHFGAHLGSIDRSFMMILFKLQIDDERLRPAYEKMPTPFRCDTSIPLFFRLLVDFVGKAYSLSFLSVLDHIIAATSPEEVTTEEEEISSDDAKKEVQFCFGWAIAYIVSVTEIGESIVGPMAAIVNSMWTTHTEIYLDKQYIFRCYPDIVHLKNRGKRAAKNMIHQENTEKDTTIRLHERLGLTLVAEQYFDFGLAC